MFQAACLQMRSGITIKDNLDRLLPLLEEAVKSGADYIQTPEMTNILQPDRPKFFEEIKEEADDLLLNTMIKQAKQHKKHLHLGSLAIKIGEKQAANRGFFISPEGDIIARYDKIHMFDITLPNGTVYKESAAYLAGNKAVIAKTPIADFGVTICYDMRFPLLYQKLAKAGATVLTMPSSFTVPTGLAHWHVLLRARAIETGSFVIAAAQGGRHACGRDTFGHSLIINPWGEILAEKNDNNEGVIIATVNPDEAFQTRTRIPTLSNAAQYDL